MRATFQELSQVFKRTVIASLRAVRLHNEHEGGTCTVLLEEGTVEKVVGTG